MWGVHRLVHVVVGVFSCVLYCHIVSNYTIKFIPGVEHVFFSWPVIIVVGLVLSQVIIQLVTVYFHRACSHKSVILSNGTNRVCRFLAWFLIAMDPREFAAVHRKHHAKVDGPEDPHSPVNHGWMGVLFGGLPLYRRAAEDKQLIEKYGKGLPVDPWEGFYQKHRNLGVLFFAAVLLVLFSWPGLILWGVLMLWIPFWAAGVVNGLGHRFGYRNYQTEDHSTNLSPWGVWIGGEELHNNHHAYPASARFSRRPWEFDFGWQVIRLLRALGLAQVRQELSGSFDVVLHGANTAHPIKIAEFLRDRHEWLDRFHQAVDSSQEVVEQIRQAGFKSWRRLSRRSDHISRMGRRQCARISAALSVPAIASLRELEVELRAFWTERGRANPEAVHMWAERARDFASRFAMPKLADYANALSPPRLDQLPA